MPLLRTLVAVAGTVITITGTSIAITGALIGIISTYSSPRASASAAPRCPTPEPTGRHLRSGQSVGTVSRQPAVLSDGVHLSGMQMYATPHRAVPNGAECGATYRHTAYDMQHTAIRHSMQRQVGPKATAGRLPRVLAAGKDDCSTRVLTQ